MQSDDMMNIISCNDSWLIDDDDDVDDDDADEVVNLIW